MFSVQRRETLALNHIVPVAIAYQNQLIKNVKGLIEIGLGKNASESQINLIEFISKHINVIEKSVNQMVDMRKKVNQIEDASKKAKAYCDDVLPFFEAIRYSADKLELLIDNKTWPLPKYREMLFMN